MILEKLFLNVALSTKTESNVCETLANEEVMLLTEVETFTRLVLRFVHIFETFVQQEFRYPVVVVSVFNEGRIVIVCEFSRAAHLPETEVIDKLILSTSVDMRPVVVSTLV